ncbi:MULTISPECIES: undecaprenyl-diphosphate phosphatase [Pseudomonas]|uniref:Undecaprenyl-diphosphatase n=1 Tax=Ectopseudomonas oleovorans TaxID=301 RepID=A0A653BBY8_ECTOL|nr:MULTISPECIES: undecaprenyl-diphosphate phosphatase [Pseudomonas]QTS84351.1 undecaprenyl-diphosphate phosphatase [Pseudomonas khazarica]CAE6926412.1 Undecaprenyl-diphosphatase [Pseudomonas oleovorans]HIQ44950.1 undecaprenyl-diphosphate phosphatase [Pseudomonas oleovorans]
MDIWMAFQALMLGVVEGLTEFLPISSTGHLIVVGDLLGFNGEKATAFKIIIQLGAILAVMWEFRAKVVGVLVGLPSDPKARRFSFNLFLAFIPAVIFGLAFADLIEHWLFNPITVATALILGGIVMLWAERREHPIQAESVDDMTWQLALKVGFAQCLALIPGTSRSGATIIGGLVCGLSRKAATEFSFFLAMPTMVAATVYSLVKYRDILQTSDLPIFAIGFVSTFIVAMITVRALLRFITNHSYAVFAWYRIAFGLLILATWQLHLIDWSTAQP